MDDIEFIKELDKRIDLIRDTWADQLVELLNNKKIEQGSARFDRESKKLSKKYAPLMADILMLRNQVFDKAYQKQEEDFAAQFVSSNIDRGEVNEYGRPLDVYWKDGAWHKYNRPKKEQKD